MNEQEQKDVALWWSAGSGHVECVKTMITSGANVNSVWYNGKTFLITAERHVLQVI